MGRVILRGIPGSGKSTVADKLAHYGARVCSADSYFIGDDGVYRFNPANIGAAHGSCFAKAVREMQSGRGCIVIDNTNITAVEIAPYVLAAQAFGHTVEIVNVTCAVGIADARGVHGVPTDVVHAMWIQMQNEALMPWWTVRNLTECEWYDVVSSPLGDGSALLDGSQV
jgi:predicted kinase